MPGHSFAERLGQFIRLTQNESEALRRLEQRERVFRRGQAMVRENDALGELFVLKRGLAMSYVLLDDGSRQILRFLFPGDLLGCAGLAYRRSPETICALAESTACAFDRSAMAQLAVDHPRLIAAIMALYQMDRVALTDRLAGLGRTSAKARVAAVLLEVRDRLRRNDATVDGSFTLGLTQEEMGDASGLTAVHVNRMLRQLEDEGLIARDNGRYTLLDERALKRSANYVDRFDGVDLSWLPPPR